MLKDSKGGSREEGSEERGLQFLVFHPFIALPDHLRQRLVPDSFN